jgi:hypothetical protein
VNPCGARPLHTQMRKRFKHKWQEHSTVCRVEFAERKDEELKEGPITKLEFFVMVNICEYCDEEDIDPTTENLSSLYHQIVAATTYRLYFEFANFNRTNILRFIQQHKKDFDIFKAVCDMQLDWNNTKPLYKCY